MGGRSHLRQWFAALACVAVLSNLLAVRSAFAVDECSICKDVLQVPRALTFNVDYI